MSSRLMFNFDSQTALSYPQHGARSEYHLVHLNQLGRVIRSYSISTHLPCLWPPPQTAHVCILRPLALARRFCCWQASPATTASGTACAATGPACAAPWCRPSGAAPTLVIHGSQDEINTSANARLLTNRIPGAQLQLIDGERHSYFEEFRGVASPLVLKFRHSRPLPE